MDSKNSVIPAVGYKTLKSYYFSSEANDYADLGTL